jgi:hypothetical protein
MQNSENYRHKNFWSNIDPGKTHKGKTSERGLFIIYELQRNFFYSIFIFRNYKNLSQTFIRKILLNSPGKCSSISVPEIRTTVRLSQQLMLYGLSRFSCQISAKTVRNMQQEQLLENVLYDPRNSCQNCTDCTETHPEIYDSRCLDFCANK